MTGPTVIIGTSIEDDDSVSGWRPRLAARLGLDLVDRSLGGGAYTGNNAAGDNLRKHVDAAVAEFPPGTMYLAGPVNDLVILSDVTPLRQAVDAADGAARAAGWRVVGGAVLPFADGQGALQAGWWPNLEQRRTAYNTWAAAHFAGRYVDLTWCLHETTTWRADVRWFRDGLHPNQYGAAIMAEAFPPNALT
jgi:lysophospholipase L1-like esterase